MQQSKVPSSLGKIQAEVRQIQKKLDSLSPQLTTKIAIVLDRSGSMQSNKTDHEGGLKSFVEKQRDLQGNVDFTFIQFDDKDPCEVIYDDIPLNEVEELELNPRGMTPLLDAVGKSIAHLTSKYKGQEYSDVVFLVITDGNENSSREWTKATLEKAVKEKEEEGWQFVFLGADLADFAGEAVNFSQGKSASFSNSVSGVYCAYDMVSDKVGQYRNLRSSGQTVNTSSAVCNFSDEDRVILKGSKYGQTN